MTKQKRSCIGRMNYHLEVLHKKTLPGNTKILVPNIRKRIFLGLLGYILWLPVPRACTDKSPRACYLQHEDFGGFTLEVKFT